MSPRTPSLAEGTDDSIDSSVTLWSR